MIKSKLAAHLIITLLLFTSCDFNQQKLIYNQELDHSKEYQVILMAGQSNMVGLGEIKELNNFNLPENISLFDYSADTDLHQLPYNFGPEVGLARRLNKEFPDTNFILIKYAIGGSSINEWLPTVESKIERPTDFGNIYGKFLEFSNTTLKNHNTTNLAFLWMQGETDTASNSTAKPYGTHLKLLIRNIRRDFNDPNLPVLIGEINPKSEQYKYVQTVQNAQHRINESVPNTYLIKTNTLEKFRDSVHYSSLGLLKLGDDFGNTISKIITQKRQVKQP